MGSEYPKLLRSKRHRHVIKFTDLNTGVVVIELETVLSDRPLYAVGYSSLTWANCTNAVIWDTVTPPNKKVRLHNMIKDLLK